MLAIKVLFGDASKVGGEFDLHGLRIALQRSGCSVELSLGRRWAVWASWNDSRCVGNRHWVRGGVGVAVAGREWRSEFTPYTYRTDWWARWKQRRGLAPQPAVFDEFDHFDELLADSSLRSVAPGARRTFAGSTMSALDMTEST